MLWAVYTFGATDGLNPGPSPACAGSALQQPLEGLYQLLAWPALAALVLVPTGSGRVWMGSWRALHRRCASWDLVKH